MSNFNELPLSWDQPLQDRLPPSTKRISPSAIHTGYFEEESHEPFLHDKHLITTFLKINSLPLPSHQSLLHAWLCGTPPLPSTTNAVNTRCVYYHHTPLPSHHKDNMTLAPLIDMINHSSQENVTVTRASNALEIRASRIIDDGEEIAFSYHSAASRFWVCEYGFWFEGNEYNDLDVTAEVERLVVEKRTWLEDHGYWGYVL
jgi:hypothetical protein